MLAMRSLAALAALVATTATFLSSFVSAEPPSALLASALRNPSGIAHLDSAAFNSIVNEAAATRDYSMSILLTALNAPGIDCVPCKAFQPHYEGVAAAWKKNGKGWKDGKAGHYFVEVNFVDGREVFQQLQIQHAPMLLFLPPHGPANKGISYDFNAHGFDAPGVSSHISQLIGKPIGYKKPFPWRTAIIFSLTAMVATSAVLYVVAKVQAQLEASSGGQKSLNWRSAVGWVLQLVCLATITIMCAGYMWNNIRGAPYMSMGSNGKVEYFAGGFQNQLGVETQIVASIYGILAFSLIALTVLVPTQRDPVKQRAGVYVWSVIFLGGVSVLFAVFRIKNPSYPLRLFL